MEQSPCYWRVLNRENNYIARLQDLCTQFTISYDDLTHLLEIDHMILAGGAALYCLTGATENKDTSYSGDIDIYVHYNSGTIFHALKASNAILSKNGYTLDHTRSSPRIPPTSCEKCNEYGTDLFRVNPCNHFLCENCLAQCPDNLQECKCLCSVCNTLSTNIPFDFRKVGLRQDDTMEDIRFRNFNRAVYQHLKQIKFFREYVKEYHKIQLIFVCNPTKYIQETFDLSCCCVFLRRRDKEWGCYTIHRKLVLGQVAIWMKEAELTEHELVRIAKYIRKGFRIFTTNAALAKYCNASEFGQTIVPLLVEQGIPREVCKHVIVPYTPFLEFAASVPDIYTITKLHNQ